MCTDCTDVNCDICASDTCTDCSSGYILSVAGVCVTGCPATEYGVVDTDASCTGACICVFVVRLLCVCVSVVVADVCLV